MITITPHSILKVALLFTFISFPLSILADSYRVNVNSANLKQLMSLPYIGEQRARAIIKSRNQVGKFRTINELVTRRIIGRDTFEAIKPRISLYPGPSAQNVHPVSITNIHINGLKGNIFFLENRNYSRLLSSKIDTAKDSIRIVMFLFKTSENKYNVANQLADQLIQAQERGVSVEVIMELSGYNHTLNESNESTLKKLRRNGIKVRFDSVKRQTHTKLVIVDEKYTFIGSHNFSHSALCINNELSLMIESREIAKKSLDYFRSII